MLRRSLYGSKSITNPRQVRLQKQWAGRCGDKIPRLTGYREWANKRPSFKSFIARWISARFFMMRGRDPRLAHQSARP